jgi:phospholipid transport system substrate-binding protein
VKDTDNAEVVDAKMVTDKPEKVSINYKLHLVNEEWKIYDIVIDNISPVNDYRSRFNRVIVQILFRGSGSQHERKNSRRTK